MGDGPSIPKSAPELPSISSDFQLEGRAPGTSGNPPPDEISKAPEPTNNSLTDSRPGKEQPYKFMVRLPSHMRLSISEAAQHYRRSMNSEIVARLQQSLSGIPEDASPPQVEGPLHPQLERILKPKLSEIERQLIQDFRRLGKEKQSALLKLLK